MSFSPPFSAFALFTFLLSLSLFPLHCNYRVGQKGVGEFYQQGGTFRVRATGSYKTMHTHHGARWCNNVLAPQRYNDISVSRGRLLKLH